GEEGAGAPRVVVGGVEHHALATTQVQHRAAYVGHGGASSRLDPERGRQLGVADGGSEPALSELEGHLEDDVSAGVGLEPARAGAEPAGGGGEGGDAAERAVPSTDGGKGLGDLLAVGTDVLDGGRADRAGDARQGLDADPPALDSRCYEGFPRLPG